MRGNSIDLQTTGLVELAQELVRIANALSGPPMSAAMLKAISPVLGGAQSFAKPDTSSYKNSLRKTVEIGADYVVGVVGSPAEHAPYAVYPTRPHWPPSAPIIAWAARHGMDESAAYAIIRTIAKRGTHGDLSLPKALAQFGPGALRELEQAISEIVEGTRR